MPARRTKILATLGPASDSPEMLARLVDAGMDAVRVNFSHGEAKHHAEVVARVRAVAQAKKRAIPIVQDIQGPKIRVGKLPGGPIKLAAGDRVTLTAAEEAPGPGVIPITYEWLAKDVKPGGQILLDDGYLEMKVEACEGEKVHATVVTGGLLKPSKGVNFPGARLSIKFPTEKDKVDLRVGQDLGVDWVAASFVRSAADVARVRADLDDAHGTRVIAKIELHEAVENLDEIVRSADAVMIARGDLGVEFPPEEVPGIQRRILQMGDTLGVPVITATQMLESMIEQPRPTRAEVTDVYNAILGGSGAVMLSGETAVGKHPVEAVSVMARVARRAEETFFSEPELHARWRAVARPTAEDAVAHATVRAAEDAGAKAIVVLTESGRTAILVAKYRPKTRVLAATPSSITERQLALVWGVETLHLPHAETQEKLFRSADDALLAAGLAKGDTIVVTSGRLGASGSTSSLRVAKVGKLAQAAGA
ncbi:MAG TPA: pyruvate kinase [Candidatus Thermoplasmatota archaeon]|nr:pyruvate kinase [Candidatus Thermoplasmatota archaeon]